MISTYIECVVLLGIQDLKKCSSGIAMQIALANFVDFIARIRRVSKLDIFRYMEIPTAKSRDLDDRPSVVLGRSHQDH